MTKEEMMRRGRPASMRIPMGKSQRAAQFVPFAALEGFEEEIRAAEGEREEKIEPDEEEKEEIDRKLRSGEGKRMRIRWYEPEEGHCRLDEGTVRRVDAAGREILLASGKRIPLDMIVGLEVEESAKM